MVWRLGWLSFPPCDREVATLQLGGGLEAWLAELYTLRSRGGLIVIRMWFRGLAAVAVRISRVPEIKTTFLFEHLFLKGFFYGTFACHFEPELVLGISAFHKPSAMHGL